MTAQILDGKTLAREIKDEVMLGVDKLGFQPTLATVLVGDDPASELYIDLKQKACDEIGILTKNHVFDSTVAQSDVLDLIRSLNEDEKINGILVQLPLPEGIDVNCILQEIHPLKDVDGFTPKNLGALIQGDEVLVSATPQGIITLLNANEIDVKGKDVVIVNHSIVVGKPLACLFINRDATVTICNEFTENLAEKTKTADILVSATGVAHLITEDMVKEGAVVIDAGITRVDDKIKGDVDFTHVKKKASYITPVPGGVGPLTIASLLSNTLDAAKLQKHCNSYDSGCLN